MDKIIPAAGNLLIKPLEDQPQISQNVIIANKNETPLQVGDVMAVGKPYLSNEGTVIAPPANVGGRIIYRYQGWENVILNNKYLRLIPFSAVVGVYDEK